MALTPEQQRIADLFERHMGAELEGDLDTTMATMNDNPHLNHVPVLAGGVGREGVRDFYANHLVGKFFPRTSSSTASPGRSARTSSSTSS